MLTGHLEPDGGDVLVRGQRMSGRPANVYAAMGVARTFQQTQLFGRMTVLENMLVPGLARPHSPWDEVARRARRYLDFLSLSDVEQLPAKNLSGGQQKLLELGRCLMLEPAVLFLDEPFAGVHPRLRDKLLDRIRELHQGGRTFVVVDHDMESILRISRRLVVMARGSKIADGEPDARSEEHTSELQSQSNLVCRLLLEKKKTKNKHEVLAKCKNQLTTDALPKENKSQAQTPIDSGVIAFQNLQY